MPVRREAAFQQALAAFYDIINHCSSILNLPIKPISLEAAVFLQDAHANFSSIYQQTYKFYKDYSVRLVKTITIPFPEIPNALKCYLDDPEYRQIIFFSAVKEMDNDRLAIIQAIKHPKQLLEKAFEHNSENIDIEFYSHLLSIKLKNAQDGTEITFKMSVDAPYYVTPIARGKLSPDGFADAALDALTIYFNTVSQAVELFLSGICKTDVSKFIMDQLGELRKLPNPFHDIMSRTCDAIKAMYITSRIFCDKDMYFDAKDANEAANIILNFAIHIVNTLIDRVKLWVEDIAHSRRKKEQCIFVLDTVASFAESMVRDYVAKWQNPDHWHSFVAERFPQYYDELFYDDKIHHEIC